MSSQSTRALIVALVVAVPLATFWGMSLAFIVAIGLASMVSPGVAMLGGVAAGGLAGYWLGFDLSGAILRSMQ